jgi:hypothetical protein
MGDRHGTEVESGKTNFEYILYYISITGLHAANMYTTNHVRYPHTWESNIHNMTDSHIAPDWAAFFVAVESSHM